MCIIPLAKNIYATLKATSPDSSLLQFTPPVNARKLEQLASIICDGRLTEALTLYTAHLKNVKSFTFGFVEIKKDSRPTALTSAADEPLG